MRKDRARSGRFCPACRPMQAEPDAALPPRSAPRSEHAARWECSVSETPRAAADRDAATPRKTSPPPGAARAKRMAVFSKTLRPAHPHRTRHPGHFSGQRKVSVLMRTTWGGPGSASAGWCFPGLNQKASKAGRRSGRFCPALRPVPAEPDAALPPRSAPRSEHAARCECSVSETPRAAASRDAATPRKTSHPRAARRKGRAALIQMLRPDPPHRQKKRHASNQKPPQGRGEHTPKWSTWTISGCALPCPGEVFGWMRVFSSGGAGGLGEAFESKLPFPFSGQRGGVMSCAGWPRLCSPQHAAFRTRCTRTVQRVRSEAHYAAAVPRLARLAPGGGQGKIGQSAALPCWPFDSGQGNTTRLKRSPVLPT